MGELIRIALIRVYEILTYIEISKLVTQSNILKPNNEFWSVYPTAKIVRPLSTKQIQPIFYIKLTR